MDQEIKLLIDLLVRILVRELSDQSSAEVPPSAYRKRAPERVDKATQ